MFEENTIWVTSHSSSEHIIVNHTVTLHSHIVTSMLEVIFCMEIILVQQRRPNAYLSIPTQAE